MLNCLDASIKKFNKGEYILHEGDNVHEICLVLSGCAIVVQEDSWGNRNILSKIEPSQCFATVYACSRDKALNVSVIADMGIKILVLDIRKILASKNTSCEHHNIIIHNLIAELADKNLTLATKLTHMGKRSTKEKIMSYLSSESQKCGKAKFNIPFSRQQMADYLGVERSGLSLELSKMKKAGMIDYNKNHFVIKAQR